MEYNLSRQEKPNYCIPAVLQAILRRYDEESTQQDIAAEIELKESGAGFDEHLEFFFAKRNLQYSYYNYNETPLNEPESLLQEALMQGLDVLVGYDAGNKLHVQLMEDFRGVILTLLDPSDAECHHENFFKMLNRMSEKKSGGFGLVGKLS
jgi:hypothetical protein